MSKNENESVYYHPDGRPRTYDERAAYRRAAENKRHEIEAESKKLAEKPEPGNPFRDRAEALRNEAESALITPSEKYSALRRAKVFDNLAEQKDTELQKAARQAERQNDRRYQLMTDAAERLGRSFGAIYPASKDREDLRDRIVAIASADIPVDEAWSQYTAVVSELENLEADATRAAALAAREAALKAEADALRAELAAAKQGQKAAGVANE